MMAGNLAGWIACHLSCWQAFSLSFWQDRFLAGFHVSKIESWLSFKLA
jgi:hypothetical protein